MCMIKKGKVLPHLLPSAGPGADPGVQSVRLQLTFKSSKAVGCHYFPPGLRSPSQPKNVTVLRPVPSYTAYWQRNVGVNNLPKVVTQLCPGEYWTRELLIARPTPYRYPTAPPKYIRAKHNYTPCIVKQFVGVLAENWVICAPNTELNKSVFTWRLGKQAITVMHGRNH